MRMIGMVALVAAAMLALTGVASAGPIELPFLYEAYEADSGGEPAAFVAASAASAVSAPAATTRILDDRDVRP